MLISYFFQPFLQNLIRWIFQLVISKDVQLRLWYSILNIPLHYSHVRSPTLLTFLNHDCSDDFFNDSHQIIITRLIIFRPTYHSHRHSAIWVSHHPYPASYLHRPSIFQPCLPFAPPFHAFQSSHHPVPNHAKRTTPPNLSARHSSLPHNNIRSRVRNLYIRASPSQPLNNTRV